MINQITSLFNKTDELENYLENFKKVQKRTENKTSCQSFIKNFSNLEVILPKKLLISKVSAEKNSRIFFQALVEFSLPTSETVDFTFLVNDIAIHSDRKTLGAGSNQIVIMRNYEPLESEELSIYLLIKPKNQKALNLQMISLFVWGDLEPLENVTYSAIETSDKFMLSFIDSGSLYTLLTDKQKGEYSFTNFEYQMPAISHCFVYDEFMNELLLFRVDENGNLFLSNFNDLNEKLILTQVKKVSACSNGQGRLLACVIKNNGCEYFEIDANKNISTIKKLKVASVKPTNCYCFFNTFRGEFCIAVADKNDSNFFVSEIKQTASGANNISATYEISVELSHG